MDANNEGHPVMLPTQQIHPRYKLLLCYDIKPGMSGVYYRYVTGEFVPALGDMQIYFVEAWHTAYGRYPVRQVEFVTEDYQTLKAAFTSERWHTLEERLKAFTTVYQRRVIRYRSGFQF